MKTIIRLGLMLLAFAHLPAHAQSAEAAPDVGAGQRRAAVCFACHNANGVAVIPGVPNLAGEPRDYLESALRAYRDGQTRQNPTMNAMAKPLSDRDIANIAAYFNLQMRLNDGETAAQAVEAVEHAHPAMLAPAPSAGTAPAPVAPPAAKPTGDKAAVAAAAPDQLKAGAQVFGSVCFACHTTGAAGAPKIGDKAAWAPRLAQGNAALLAHALHGFNAMPAKGGCATCSDADIDAAVAYIESKSR
jgi:cytochrome c5